MKRLKIRIANVFDWNVYCALRDSNYCNLNYNFDNVDYSHSHGPDIVEIEVDDNDVLGALKCIAKELDCCLLIPKYNEDYDIEVDN